MHDIKAIRENPQVFEQALLRRSSDHAGIAAKLIALDDARRAAIAAAQDAQTKRNALSKEIGQAMAQKDAARAEDLKAQVNALKESGPMLEDVARKANKVFSDALAWVPNLPFDEVPQGADEHGNVEIRRHGAAPSFDFAPKEHFEIGEALGQMDFETAAKLSGSRFVVLNSGIARLSRALGQFFLDTHTAPENEGGHGYMEVNPPILVKDAAMFGTGQLPKFREDQFSAEWISFQTDKFKHSNSFDGVMKDWKDHLVFEDNSIEAEFLNAGGDDRFTISYVQGTAKVEIKNRHWLVPTAEVPLTNLVRESIIDNLDTPRRYTALTPCFRAEAGSAGRDTRGMLRQHQFEKVELVSITRPEDSRAEHERMTACAEAVLKKLGLHFRTMVLCTGDMGFGSRKTHDIEVWLPGQKTFREISSCSNCGDFQARRMNARYRPAEGGAPRFVHTLNGSGVAVGRALIAVIENYQNADGSITVPDALRRYMGTTTRIERQA